MSEFHLFVYGSLRRAERGAELLPGSTWVGRGTLHGTLYDIDGKYRALMLYGTTPVHGEIWRCPADLLLRLDEYEGVPEGLFRRIAQDVQEAESGAVYPCWLYVAGPALSRKLTPDHRITGQS